MRKLAVTIAALTEEQKELIRKNAAECGFSVDFFKGEEDEGAQDVLMEAEVIYGFAYQAARCSEKLKWICAHFAGIDTLLKPGVIGREDILLSNSAGAYGLTISEHVIMVTLMLLRRQLDYTEMSVRRAWKQSALPQHSISGSRITLLGAGDIGRNCARRLKAFGPARITAVCRSGVSSESAFDEVLPQEQLDAVLPRTDILIMSLPSTPSTVGILSKERLALLPESAYVVNVGRGDAIDEAALIDALDNDRLAGAALDVVHAEPLPSEDPLWGAKNLLLTPHVAGNFSLAYTVEKNVAMFCEDLHNYAEGRPLKYLVDRKLGY